MPYTLKQIPLKFVRNREYADYHPRVWRYKVKLLGCAEEEMQVAFCELLKILRPNLGQGHLLITLAFAQTVPEQRTRLPIKYLQFTCLVGRILEAIRKAVW
jgi:hypothetical protein